MQVATDADLPLLGGADPLEAPLRGPEVEVAERDLVEQHAEQAPERLEVLVGAHGVERDDPVGRGGPTSSARASRRWR